MPFEDDFNRQGTNGAAQPDAAASSGAQPDAAASSGAQSSGAQPDAAASSGAQSSGGCNDGNWKGPAGASSVEELRAIESLNIPAVSSYVSPGGECWDACKQRDIRRKEICGALRGRVLAYLQDQGCPTYMNVPPEKRFCYGARETAGSCPPVPVVPSCCQPPPVSGCRCCCRPSCHRYQPPVSGCGGHPVYPYYTSGTGASAEGGAAQPDAVGGATVVRPDGAGSDSMNVDSLDTLPDPDPMIVISHARVGSRPDVARPEVCSQSCDQDNLQKARAIFSDINAHRQSNLAPSGLDVLRWNDRLYQACLNHSWWMCHHKLYGHDQHSTDGSSIDPDKPKSTFQTRAYRAGYITSDTALPDGSNVYVFEIIGKASTPNGQVNAWLQDNLSRAIVESPNCKEGAVACVGCFTTFLSGSFYQTDYDSGSPVDFYGTEEDMMHMM